MEFWKKKCGGGGIRTHDTFITYTRFPGGLHRPLGHSSLKKSKSLSEIVINQQGKWLKKSLLSTEKPCWKEPKT